MVRQIDCIIYNLKFALNLILMIVFALYFTYHLDCAIICLLERSEMDLMCPLSFWVKVGGTCLSVLKPFLLGFGGFGVLLRHISPGTLHGAVVSPTLVGCVSLVSILQASNWA